MEETLRRSLLISNGSPNFLWDRPLTLIILLLTAVIVGIYAIKINKLGHTEKTSIEGIIAPGVLTLLSAILCYGLADRIYM